MTHHALRISKLLLMAAVSAVSLTSCGPSDPRVPWDTSRMVRELTSDLRQFEGLKSDFAEAEVLAWRVVDRGSGGPVDIALIWGRTGTPQTRQEWALVQGYREVGRDGAWHPSVFYRTLSAPLTRLRPGETADGTWHAFQRYPHPPTSKEACEFAAVDYLTTLFSRDRHQSAGVSRQAWLRVIREPPACDLEARSS